MPSLIFNEGVEGVRSKTAEGNTDLPVKFWLLLRNWYQAFECFYEGISNKKKVSTWKKEMVQIQNNSGALPIMKG